MRRHIEQELGQRWNEVEETLENKLRAITDRRHWLIRSSPQMLAVAEMILSHRKPMEIVRFLRAKDSQRFGDHLTDAALLGQVLRFKEEMVTALERDENDENSMTLLDLYARLSGKHVDIHAMMTKVLLFQESRLSAAYEKEEEMVRLWMKNKEDGRAEKKMHKAWKACSRELDQYSKFLMSLVAYELLCQPSSAEQRQYMHEMMKCYFPR